jgi:glycerophosphoryl diester phosphodiesterase
VSALIAVYFNSSLTPAGPGDWLGGLNIDDFEGQTIAERVVRAAHSIGADYISPTMTSGETPVEIVDPSQEGWIGFVNQTMVDVAHELGMGVKPWTAKWVNERANERGEWTLEGVSSRGIELVRSIRWHYGWVISQREQERELCEIRTRADKSRKNMLEYILQIGVDGVITDYPHEFRETLERFHPDRKIAPKGDEERVRGCLRKHIQVTGMDLPNKGYEISQ